MAFNFTGDVAFELSMKPGGNAEVSNSGITPTEKAFAPHEARRDRIEAQGPGGGGSVMVSSKPSFM